jgi:hypothetical protein
MSPIGGSGLFSSNFSKNFLKLDSINTNSSGMIDVINDFHWTSSQLSSRQDIPAIQIKENKLKTNSLYAQLAYYGLVLSDRGSEVSGRLNNLLGSSKLGSGLVGGLVNGFLNSNLGKDILGVGDKILGSVSNFGSGILGSGAIEFFTGKSPNDFLNQMTRGSLGPSGSSGVLGAYEGLYITEPTGFEYKFPYFSDGANALANAFNDNEASMSKGALGALAKQGISFAEQAVYTAVQATGGILEPGVYIEKPKFYQFGSSGDTISLSFPLINTGWATFEDVQRNWQLIYMLIYQNRPNRKSRDLVDPPCIYEVSVPGVKYMPYAFISSLSVDFMGSRRSYYINAPTLGGTTKIQTIIPDAYMVNIKLTGLVSETQNFLYHMLGGKQGIVNVIESIGGRTPVSSFLDGLNRGSGLNL